MHNIVESLIDGKTNIARTNKISGLDDDVAKENRFWNLNGMLFLFKML